MNNLLCFNQDISSHVRVVKANDPDNNKQFDNNRVTNTKYTLLTFFPRNLLEQFSRFMNLYFLLIACLQLWREVTPVNPITTWGPLIFILAVNAIKEAVDDYYRMKEDRRFNERRVKVMREGKVEKACRERERARYMRQFINY